ncbi:glycoside hydrolase family 12 protein [Apiospora arundinis]|uniref:Murein transglycosylase n=1 Tax=Apiospora arundinis TaxID=335852 RepID=A0ABR2J753_9PEZI
MKFTLPVLGALASMGAAQQASLCDQYGYHASSGYYFNNNMWGKNSGSGSGCTYVDYANSNSVGFHVNWQWSGGDNNVKAYPYAGRTLSSKRTVASIGSIQSSASWQYSGNNLRANVAYDLFTAADPNHDTSSGDYELMIWLGRLGGIQPIGSKVGTVNVAGKTWELWDGYNGAMHVFSFVAPSQSNSFNANIKDFFNYLSSNKGFPANNQYLITAQFGTEPFTGGPATFTVSSFSLNAN